MVKKIEHIIDLEDVLSVHRRKLIVLCFYQPGNEDCSNIYETLKDFEDLYRGRAVVCIIDAVKFFLLTAEYEIMDYPTICFIKNRSLVSKYCGNNEKQLSVLFSMHSAPAYFTLFQHENKSLRWPGPYEEDQEYEVTLAVQTVMDVIFEMCLQLAYVFMAPFTFLTMLFFK